ncbi:hypothetical protein [Agromyces humatus]|uniref:DUF695 domain-containing protein n=1 Tax=Agromyces humatus TaxID=279573 RepID=A0ABP4WYK4_9MICO|nr:hypothetical protein [Agromyces humatus]
MTKLNAEDATQLPIPTDDDVLERVAVLLEGAIRRQLWTLYLDEHDVQLPLIIPTAGYPHRPDEPTPEGTAAELLANRIAEIVHTAGAAAVVIAWERPGSPESTSADRGWARAFADACRERGVAVRAQLIVHDDGVRWFAPDDYL